MRRPQRETTASNPRRARRVRLDHRQGVAYIVLYTVPLEESPVERATIVVTDLSVQMFRVNGRLREKIPSWALQ